jgi:probable phosphoglycerate mutase
MKTLILFFAILMAATVSAEPFVVIVRHAEKAANGGDDPDLSPAGKARAEALARMLKDARITAIFCTEFKRTRQTTEPTAKLIGVAPTVIPAKDIAALVEKLRHLSGNALVVAHSNTIPKVFKALGIDGAIQIPDSDYRELLIVTLGDKPQLLRLHYP